MLSAKIFEYVFFKIPNLQIIEMHQNLLKIPVKDFKFSTVADLKPATLMNN